MRLRVFVLALTGCLLVGSTGCRRNYEVLPPSGSRATEAEAHERLAAAQRAEYKELQGELASMKLQIENDIRIYEMALDIEDPLNRREDPIALSRVIEGARTLHEKSAAALAVDREVFRYVKGSARTLRNYKIFAQSILDKYGQLQRAGTFVETSAMPPSDGSDLAPRTDTIVP